MGNECLCMRAKTEPTIRQLDTDKNSISSKDNNDFKKKETKTSKPRDNWIKQDNRKWDNFKKIDYYHHLYFRYTPQHFLPGFKNDKKYY